MFISSVTQAALVNWEIMFFDENNAQVGKGLFSYNTETEDTFSSHHPAPSFVPETETVKTAFTTFEWEVEGITFGEFFSRSAWWYGETHNAGSTVFFDHGITDIDRNHFHLGATWERDNLGLSFHTTDDTAANGTWELYNFQNLSSQGTFQASVVQTSAIPIPSAIIFLGSGLISLFSFRRKKHSSHTQHLCNTILHTSGVPMQRLGNKQYFIKTSLQRKQFIKIRNFQNLHHF